MLSYICNGGRLGENISYIYGLFRFCKNNNVSFDNIVVNYNYKNKSLLKDKDDEYVFHDCMEMFQNIKKTFRELNDKYFDNFDIIDIKARTDITLYYNFYKYNSNYTKKSNILFKDYWSLDDYYRLKDPNFDRELLEYICRPTKIVNRLLCKYSDILNNSLGVHVRREDYLGLEDKEILKEDVQCNMNNFYKHKKLYSKDNITEIIMNNRKKNILLVSDDVDWCLENFEFYKNVYVIEGNKPYEDMILLSLCDKVIKNPGSFFSQISCILSENNKNVKQHS